MDNHTAALESQIQQAIHAAGGKLPFAQFMELALYAPGLGYYSAGHKKFGAEGDFVTAPEISALFSFCVAEQCAQILSQLGEADILEFGAGTGVMAADILLHLESLACLPGQYYILDVSADLQQRQQQTLQQKCPHLIGRVVWLQQLPAKPLNAVVLANEVLDAMPVSLFQHTEQGLQECFVSYENNQYQLISGAIENTELARHLQQIQAEIELPVPYQSEVNLLLRPWLQSVSECLAKGVVLLFDYGYPRREYYHPQRSQGTLQCFHQHRVSEQIFQHIGSQDITAHVDFTAVAEAAVAADFDVLGYTNQTHFLLNNQLLSLAERFSVDEVERFNRNQQIKQLTLPSEMGEKFKMIALGKDYPHTFQAFSSGDKLHSL